MAFKRVSVAPGYRVVLTDRPKRPYVLMQETSTEGDKLKLEEIKDFREHGEAAKYSWFLYGTGKEQLHAHT